MQEATVSKSSLWAGRIVSTLAALFFLLDGVVKLFKPAFVVEVNLSLGYAENTIIPIAATLIICTILYLIPATSVLGAILLTGYLGGAVATHVRAGSGVFPVVFAFTFGILVWLGLYLRDSRLRSLVPLTNAA